MISWYIMIHDIYQIINGIAINIHSVSIEHRIALGGSTWRSWPQQVCDALQLRVPLKPVTNINWSDEPIRDRLHIDHIDCMSDEYSNSSWVNLISDSSLSKQWITWWCLHHLGRLWISSPLFMRQTRCKELIFWLAFGGNANDAKLIVTSQRT